MEHNPPHESHISGPKRVRNVFGSFGIKMQIILAVLMVIFAGSGLFLIYEVSEAFMVRVPRRGGILNEGVIGLPQFINPILSVSGPSQDLAVLIYAGLLKKTPDGSYAPNMASSYTVSPDFKTYTFIIRNDAVFHDNTPVTADDVIFTVEKAVDPALKSPKRINWEGVTVQKIDAKTVQFVLKQPYPFFLENATLGILPKHIWNTVSTNEFNFSNYNRNPIGSGPYILSKIKNNSGGIPLSYELEAFKKYPDGAPYISHISIKFYSNEEQLISAYKNGDIDSVNSISTSDAKILEKNNARIERAVLPRIFGIFFNQNKNSVLQYKKVRQALSVALDRPAFIENVLYGYGYPVTGPLPAEFGGLGADTKAVTTFGTSTSPLLKATAILDSDGWTKNVDGIYEKKIDKRPTTLSIDISTGDVPELKDLAEEVKKTWETLGVQVNLKVFETGDLNQNVIRARNYEALLFGQVVNRDTDLFAFWHSSERNDPGLNVSMYANATVDKLLEQARTKGEKDDRLPLYLKVQNEIVADVPAIFIYSPEFIYVAPKNLRGWSNPVIIEPRDRFIGVEKWYLETDNVWKMFVRKSEEL